MFKLRVIDDIATAREIWTEMSEKKNIYEDWDFRYIFYKYFNYPLHFYAGEVDGKIIGLLPLQRNTDKGYLEFFGGNFSEDNHVFIKPGFERYISQFYGAINEKARLEDIVIDNQFLPMEFIENKYVIDLRGINTIDEYLKKTFSSKTRAKFRRKSQEIEALNPAIRENAYGDMDMMIDLNIKSFGNNSSFNKPFRREIFHDLLRGEFDAVMLTAEIAGKKESVSFGIKYKNTFVSINSGTNKQEFPNLGTYMILRRIEKAINLGCDTFDAGLESLGWKEKWHLQRIPEYKYYREG